MRKDKVMHSKAIEAAALAIFREQLLLDDDECRRAAQASIAAYLAAMEAEGFSFVQTRQIEVVSGPPIYDPRPNVKG